MLLKNVWVISLNLSKLFHIDLFLEHPHNKLKVYCSLGQEGKQTNNDRLHIKIKTKPIWQPHAENIIFNWKPKIDMWYWNRKCYGGYAQRQHNQTKATWLISQNKSLVLFQNPDTYVKHYPERWQNHCFNFICFRLQCLKKTFAGHLHQQEYCRLQFTRKFM